MHAYFAFQWCTEGFVGFCLFVLQNSWNLEMGKELFVTLSSRGEECCRVLKFLFEVSPHASMLEFELSSALRVGLFPKQSRIAWHPHLFEIIKPKLE